jgi:dTMP kinase
MPDVAKNRPWYIAFEGAEASGKSTQAALLAKRLDAVLTRETGGTAIGSRIRDILHDTAHDALCDRAEALLTAADRAQHLAEVVEPALRSLRHVVSDRSVYSTFAYQGYGRGLNLDDLRRFNEWALSGRWPDLVLLIDVPQPILSLRMQHRRLDRFEQAGDDFHRRVADGFATMAAEDRERWVVIDGTGSIDDVATLVRRALEARGVPVALP